MKRHGFHSAMPDPVPPLRHNRAPTPIPDAPLPENMGSFRQEYLLESTVLQNKQRQTGQSSASYAIEGVDPWSH
jgi:hypothetical protein